MNGDSQAMPIQEIDVPTLRLLSSTWTVTPGVSRTSRSTTDPWRSSNQRDRRDLPTISCVARASAR